jgi:hypothetical protein
MNKLTQMRLLMMVPGQKLKELSPKQKTWSHRLLMWSRQDFLKTVYIVYLILALMLFGIITAAAGSIYTDKTGLCVPPSFSIAFSILGFFHIIAYIVFAVLLRNVKETLFMKVRNGKVMTRSFCSSTKKKQREMVIGAIIWGTTLVIWIALEASGVGDVAVGDMKNFRDIFLIAAPFISFVVHTIYPVIQTYNIEKSMKQITEPSDESEPKKESLNFERGFRLKDKVREKEETTTKATQL